MAPEVFNNSPYNEKADVFSFGVVMYELWSRVLMMMMDAGTAVPNLPPGTQVRCGTVAQYKCTTLGAVVQYTCTALGTVVHSATQYEDHVRYARTYATCVHHISI